MNPELDRALCERYPKIFAERHAPEALSCMYRGFEVDDGWYHLIDALCEELQRESDQGDAPQIVAMHVKEKLGSLRFRVHSASERQRGMIRMAETLSARLCVVCGAPAISYNEIERWRSPRCKLHELM